MEGDLSELTEVFSEGGEAEAYAKGLKAGLAVDSDFSYGVEVTHDRVTGEYTVTVEYVY